MTSDSGTSNDSVMIDNVVIRFAGDSGDGIQTTGSLFTHDSAVLGHDVSTLPDYPAEIRAPAGSLPGVSSFQLNFSSRDIHTPGDRPDVLVALNPAALKIHLADLVPGGTIIINSDSFTHQDLARAGYDGDPAGDGSLSGYRICPLPIESLTIEAVKPAGVGRKQASLCKNMFTLGLISWLYDRSLAAVEQYLTDRYATKNEQLAEANRLALRAGYHYADTVELFTGKFRMNRAALPPGKYRRVTGNEAPLNPLYTAIAAGATFAARSVATDAKHLQEMLLRAARHRGSAFVEIFQNCNVFNDGAFDSFADRSVRDERTLYLAHGEPLVYGTENNRAWTLRTGAQGVELAGVAIGEVPREQLIRHDERAEPNYLARMLACMSEEELPVPLGVFREIKRPLYGDHRDD